jgi:hypothetical protein
VRSAQAFISNTEQHDSLTVPGPPFNAWRHERAKRAKRTPSRSTIAAPLLIRRDVQPPILWLGANPQARESIPNVLWILCAPWSVERHFGRGCFALAWLNIRQTTARTFAGVTVARAWINAFQRPASRNDALGLLMAVQKEIAGVAESDFACMVIRTLRFSS